MFRRFQAGSGARGVACRHGKRDGMKEVGGECLFSVYILVIRLIDIEHHESSSVKIPMLFRFLLLEPLSGTQPCRSMPLS